MPSIQGALFKSSTLTIVRIKVRIVRIVRKEVRIEVHALNPGRVVQIVHADHDNV